MDMHLVGMAATLAGWAIGLRIGWTVVDRFYKKRDAEKERRLGEMRNVTPKEDRPNQ